MCFSIGIIFIGVVVFVVGMLVWTGRFKKWYLYEGDPLYSPKEFLYVWTPLGLAFLSFGLASLLPTQPERFKVFLWLSLPLALIASLLLFWLPDWIKPAWVRWLETNHKDILLLLLRQARKTPNWEQRVANQDGLEAWVAEVRQKHNLPASTTPILQEQGRSWLQRKWPVGLIIVAVSSGLGQYLLGSGLIGFIVGWVMLGFIYLLRPRG